MIRKQILTLFIALTLGSVSLVCCTLQSADKDETILPASPTSRTQPTSTITLDARQSVPTSTPAQILTATQNENITVKPTRLVATEIELVTPTPFTDQEDALDSNAKPAVSFLLAYTNEPFAPFICHSPGLNIGELWIFDRSNQHYEKLLGEHEVGLVNPVVSHKGNLVAAIGIQSTVDIQKDITEFGIMSTYVESDGIWVLDLHTGSYTNYGPITSRLELAETRGTCLFVQGIVKLENWSMDDQWISYLVMTGVGGHIGLLNTRENVFYDYLDIREGSWAKSSLRYAGAMYIDGVLVLKLIDLEHNLEHSIVAPSTLVDFFVDQIEWVDENMLSIVLSQSLGVVGSISELWVINLINEEWKKVGEIGNNLSPNILLRSEVIVTCAGNSLDKTITILETSSLVILYQVSLGMYFCPDINVLPLDNNRTIIYIPESDLLIHEVELSSTGIQENKIVIDNEYLGGFTNFLVKILPIVSGE